MFNKAAYIKTLQDTGIYTNADAEKLAEKMQMKYSTIKRGPKVIHLDYYGSVLDENDISEIEHEVNNAGLELSRFDKSGVAFASVDDYTLHIALFISSPISKLIFEHLGKNIAWEVVKASAIKIWRKVKSKRDTQQSTGVPKKVNVGLRISLDNGKITDFHLDGELAEETVLIVMDKVLNYSERQNQLPVDPGDMPGFVEYDEELDELKLVDVMQEFRKMAEAQAAKRKAGSAGNASES